MFCDILEDWNPFFFSCYTNNNSNPREEWVPDFYHNTNYITVFMCETPRHLWPRFRMCQAPSPCCHNKVLTYFYNQIRSFLVLQVFTSAWAIQHCSMMYNLLQKNERIYGSYYYYVQYTMILPCYPHWNYLSTPHSNPSWKNSMQWFGGGIYIL